jgi:trimethylamine:corrinoid methyltransferase-like protein
VNVGPRRRKPAPEVNLRSAIAGTGGARAHARTGVVSCNEVMDGAEVEKIDAASMDILENVGVQFRDEIALEDWRKVGAKVVGERVYLDRGLVRDLIATIPEPFTYHARNPANNLPSAGRHRSSCR